jgi:PAS domain S-box-containing protein
VDRIMAGQAAEAAPGVRPADGLVCADDLPDGLVIADDAGRVTCFNRAAARLTGIVAASAVGRDVREVLPLRDADDRCWWTQTQPYQGLRTRSRHPERSLFLPDGTELLVTMGYVRDWAGDGDGRSQPVAVRRLAVTLRGNRQRNRAEPRRPHQVTPGAEDHPRSE